MPGQVCGIIKNHFLSVPSKLEQVICLLPGKSWVECSNLINGSILARLAEANLMKSHLILATLISTLLLAISDIWSSGDNSSSRPLGGRPRYIQPDRQQNSIHHQFSLSYLPSRRNSSPKVSLHNLDVTSFEFESFDPTLLSFTESS